jgi:hypothetical protein
MESDENQALRKTVENGQSIIASVKMTISNNKKLKGGLTNLKGIKIGYLLVIKRLYVKGRAKWLCECTAEGCGEEIKVGHNRLIDKSNPKTHCGCLRGGLAKIYKKEYHAWWDAKSRCHNPEHPSYKGYGAKGITMELRWQESFDNFFEDMGEVPKGQSLDRIDAHGPYAKYNCRWATDLEQARNKKGTVYVKHPKTGERLPAAAYAEELGITYQQLRNQLIAEGKWKAKEKKDDREKVG